MGLKCPKCGTDNLLTSIFCRGCGEKLDLNAMKPDTVQKAGGDKAKKKTSPAAKAVTAGLTVLLILFIAAFFCPTGGLKGNEPSEQAKKDFQALQKTKSASSGKKKNKNKKTAPAPAQPKSFTFNDDDSTALANKTLGLPKKEGNEVLPQNLSVRYQEDNTLQLILTCKLFGFLPMDNVLYVKAEMNSGKLEFTPLSARIGFIPMIGGSLIDIVVQKITPTVDNSTLKTVRNNIKSISTSKGSVTLGM